MTYPNDKDPRFAFILGLALGFLGIGHFYMGKVVKGLILLIVRGFLAIFSLVAISMLFGPSEFELSIRMVTTAIMSVPYLLLQLWQAFDTPKPGKGGQKGDTDTIVSQTAVPSKVLNAGRTLINESYGRTKTQSGRLHDQGSGPDPPELHGQAGGWPFNIQ